MLKIVRKHLIKVLIVFISEEADKQNMCIFYNQY